MLGIRKRYWIVALAQFGAGLFFYFFVYAYQFTGILLCALSVVTIAFGALNLVKRTIFRTIFLCAVTLGFVMAVITGVQIGTTASGSEDPEADFVIVLGAGVNGTQPSASLSERLRAAKIYAEEYPDSILILSGGQGNNEDITEAKCMYDWLIAHGVSATQLRMEDQATSTVENIEFSMALIEEEFGKRPESVCIISSEYHLLRASKIAESVNVDALLYPAETQNKFYFCNMFLREIFGIWHLELGL